MEDKFFLRVQDLSKRYNHLQAVDQISFSVHKGEVFSLLGPNGAGKSTTIKMVCGLLRPDAGRIEIGEDSISTDFGRTKHRIGLCPQEIVIWELLTCYEQLKFIGLAYGFSAREAGLKAESLMESLGLTEKRNKLGRTLSGGLQRRLNIALALVHDPELLILDEPQAGLDPQGRILVRDFIRQLAKKKTVILTTHDMDEADRLSDRVAIIDHGRILLIDTPDRIKEKSGLGDLLQIRIPGIENDLAQKVLDSMPAGFTERRYLDGLILLGGKEVLELIPAANRSLKNFDIPVQDMTIRKHTLEDAFIRLTGRGLRE